MVRIKDIAEALGVSTATVSNVINGKNEKVSERVRKQVEQAIEEMGYVRNVSATMLAQTHSKIIGVVIPVKDESKITLEDPYFSSLVGNLEYAIRQKGYQMHMLLALPLEEILTQSKAWNMDGLILCNLKEEQLEAIRKEYRGGMVSIDSYLNKKTNFVNIMTDDFGGGYSMAQYLYAKGHRKIAMIADNDAGVDHYRWMGFVQALKENGVEVSAEDHIIIRSENAEREPVYEKLKDRFLQYTALFAASDFYAMEISSFLQRKGIRIPEDISIAGFDDLLYAELAKPGLTTVRQDIGEKAAMAVEALLSLGDPGTAEKQWLLKVSIKERDSVKGIGDNA